MAFASSSASHSQPSNAALHTPRRQRLPPRPRSMPHMAGRALAGAGQRLRPLMPASASHPTTLASETTETEPKEMLVGSACQACHRQKTKCSGQRPTCRRCFRRGTQCHYSTPPGETTSQALKRRFNNLRDQAAANADVLDLLTRLPEAEAQAVFKRIRSGHDVGAIVNHVRDGDVLLQMALEPESRFRYSFPYGSEMPSDIVANNPYLDSFIYEAPSLYASSSTGKALATSLQGPWTVVCSDDTLMRDVLSVWLRCEHHFTAVFQKDYFLEDLAAGRQDCCSSLLVNVVLAYACLCYPQFANRAEYWNPETLYYRFLAEAKRLWELEATKPHLTPIHAGIIFNVLIQAVVLARKLGLFHGPSPPGNLRTRNSSAYTAWALYNWETLFQIHPRVWPAPFAHGILVDPMPRPLSPRYIVLPGHLQLHMFYHHLLLAGPSYQGEQSQNQARDKGRFSTTATPEARPTVDPKALSRTLYTVDTYA
ncbi:hypothetical protein Micbo1qcDRAFT_180969 [Microdochium bolleyi]|uniref:Zn(2)-C6 fungal-type domain-containing protein n=1 Tax=Microdochium bolleyi TaxID=196109 RepID=A0A136IJV9_9PEZI|nr:hypothetical protein Micbo1qcDRAFT_180969 [Microdochium bolleyi]